MRVGIYAPFPRSGKSTFARELVRLGNGQIVKCADPLREGTAAFVGPFFEGRSRGKDGQAEVRSWMDDSRKDTNLVPMLGVTLRHCLQTFGTWGRQCIHPDIWVKLLKERLGNISLKKLVVVDDVRFENEHALLRRMDATLIKISRKDLPYVVPHESNGRLDSLPFDYHITNDGTEEDLKLKALTVAWDLGLTP